MKFVRVTSYIDGVLAGEWVHLGDDQVEALDRVNRYYPEHRGCVKIAQTIDDEDEKWNAYISKCLALGCQV